MSGTDYSSRKLDFCHFCGLTYNVGERIPRILVNCGHTFCTECLAQLHHRQRVRCPICRKLLKGLDNVERLPLNINMLYEVTQNDPVLKAIDFNDCDEENLVCGAHSQRLKHFYCSNHQTVFCRECIKSDHTDEDCFVVDLYEIEKMKKLHRQNVRYNCKQFKKRGEPNTYSFNFDSDEETAPVMKPAPKMVTKAPPVSHQSQVKKEVKQYIARDDEAILAERLLQLEQMGLVNDDDDDEEEEYDEEEEFEVVDKNAAFAALAASDDVIQYVEEDDEAILA